MISSRYARLAVMTSSIAVCTVTSALLAQQPPPAQQPPRAAPAPNPAMIAQREATEADHQDMMDQLGIKALRPGPSGNEQAPNHANYDEALANPYPELPRRPRR